MEQSTKMETFQSKEFGSVRVMNEDGEFLFAGVDVAKALDYRSPIIAVLQHCKNIVKRDVPNPVNAEATFALSFVPESDVRNLIENSSSAKAEAFESWLMDGLMPMLQGPVTYYKEEQKQDTNGDMQVFQHDEFGNIRVVKDGEKYLFCGVDVANSLGYANPWSALKRHCKEDGLAKREVVSETTNQHGVTTKQCVGMIFITEGNVYRLIAHSKLPSAERFERWVFDEVLPSIRKHGAYMTDSTLEQVCRNPEAVLLIVDKLLQERNKNEYLEAELSDARPKASFYDAFVDGKSYTNIRVTAKELEIPERQFCKFLIDAGFLYRAPAGNLLPYNKPSNDGLFVVRDYFRHGHMGSYTLLTAKGKDLIRLMLHSISA